MEGKKALLHFAWCKKQLGNGTSDIGFLATFAFKKIRMRKQYLLWMLTAAFLCTHAQENGTIRTVSLTLGLGNIHYGKAYGTVVPPLTASYESECLPQAFGLQELTIGLGGTVGFMAVQSTTAYGDATLTSHISELLIAMKISGHYPLLPLPKCDTYASLLLGWGIAGNKNDWEGNEETIALAKSLGWEHQEKVGGPFFGIMAGCRYWFTRQLAGNVEIGYGPAFLNIGGSYRF